MDKIFDALATFLTAALIIVLVAIMLTFPVMWLWNWLMPMIFGLMELDFWQTLGLSLLCSFLFKSSSSSKS